MKFNTTISEISSIFTEIFRNMYLNLNLKSSFSIKIWNQNNFINFVPHFSGIHFRKS